VLPSVAPPVLPWHATASIFVNALSFCQPPPLTTGNAIRPRSRVPNLLPCKIEDLSYRSPSAHRSSSRLGLLRSCIQLAGRATQIGSLFPSGGALVVALTVLWISVANRTLQLAWTGFLYHSPCLIIADALKLITPENAKAWFRLCCQSRAFPKMP
jgi:hypothetical protein